MPISSRFTESGAIVAQVQELLMLPQFRKAVSGHVYDLESHVSRSILIGDGSVASFPSRNIEKPAIMALRTCRISRMYQQKYSISHRGIGRKIYNTNKSTELSQSMGVPPYIPTSVYQHHDPRVYY